MSGFFVIGFVVEVDGEFYLGQSRNSSYHPANLSD